MNRNLLDRIWNAWKATMIILAVFAIGEGTLMVPKDAWALALSSAVDAQGNAAELPTD